MKTPCTNCLTLAICRNKHYDQFYKECSLFREYALCRNDRWEDGDVYAHRRKFLKVLNVVKPRKWSISKLNEKVGFTINMKRGAFG